MVDFLSSAAKSNPRDPLFAEPSALPIEHPDTPAPTLFAAREDARPRCVIDPSNSGHPIHQLNLQFAHLAKAFLRMVFVSSKVEQSVREIKP